MESIQTPKTSFRQLNFFLRMLFIFSFAYVGNGAIGTVLEMISGPLSEMEMKENIDKAYNSLVGSNTEVDASTLDLLKRMLNMSHYTNENFYVDKVMNLLAFCIGFYGLVLMLRFNEKGIHFYIIYNLLMVFLVYISVPFKLIPWQYILFNLLFSAFFVLIYYRGIPWIKDTSTDEA